MSHADQQHKEPSNLPVRYMPLRFLHVWLQTSCTKSPLSFPTLLISFEAPERLCLLPATSSQAFQEPRRAWCHGADFSKKGKVFGRVAPPSRAAVQATKGPLLPVGHSLGGALTQVFAAALAAHHPELADRVSGMYTYGMPRVGDSAFSLAMEARYPGCAFRITHAADIIPLASLLTQIKGHIVVL